MKNNLPRRVGLSTKFKYLALYVAACIIHSSFLPLISSTMASSVHQQKGKTTGGKPQKAPTPPKPSTTAETGSQADKPGEANPPTSEQPPGQQPAATKPAPISQDEFEITPSRTVSRASDTVLTIKSKQCPANNKFLVKGVITPAERERLKDSITFHENPIVESDGCVLKLGLTVLSTASSHVDFNLALEGDKVASITLTITKEEPLPPKPIPPGLTPQVDVMWRVVPQRIVKDNFGTRVGKLFYCLEVIIGNNTGYDLQIAAVGFQVGPLGDATKTMAELLRKSYQEADESGKVLLDAAQSSARAATALAIAAREEGLRDLRAELLASQTSKSPTPSREEMDSACKADTQCVALTKKAGDARARAVILSREADLNNKAADEVSKAQRFSSQALLARRNELAAKSQLIYQTNIPTSSYRMTRGSLEHGQFWSVRNLTINSLRAFGPFLTGFTPFFRNINHQRNYSQGINIISNPLEKGFELIVPDETVSQLQRLDEQILRDGLIIQNNRQIVTHTFMPKDNLGLDKKMRDDPLMVTLALGTLTIIGDQIQYLNRVSVTSGPSGEIKPPPTINLKPIETFLLREERSITLTGTNLDEADVTSDSTSTIDVKKTANTTGSVTVSVTAKDETTLGTHNLILRTQSGSPVTIPINIERPAPTVDTAKQKITQSNDTPSKTIRASLTEDMPYEIKVEGLDLQGATLTPLELNGKKLKLTNSQVVVAPDGKSFTADIIVPKETTPGLYKIEIRNDRPVNNDKPATIQVEIAAQEGPTIETASQTILKDTSDKPINVNPAKSQDYTILVKGNNLNGAKLRVKAGSNSVGKLEIVSPDEANTKAKELTKTIKIKPEAKPSNDQPVDYELEVATTSGTAPLKIRVNAQPPATITSPTQPVPAKAGQTIQVTVVGTNLEGAQITPPTGWTKPTPTNPEGTQFTLDIAVPANALPAGTTEQVFDFSVANSNGTAVPPKFKVKVTPP